MRELEGRLKKLTAALVVVCCGEEEGADKILTRLGLSAPLFEQQQQYSTLAHSFA